MFSGQVVVRMHCTEKTLFNNPMRLSTGIKHLGNVFQSLDTTPVNMSPMKPSPLASSTKSSNVVDVPIVGSTSKPEMSIIIGVHSSRTSTVAPLSISATGDLIDCETIEARGDEGSDEYMKQNWLYLNQFSDPLYNPLDK